MQRCVTVPLYVNHSQMSQRQIGLIFFCFFRSLWHFDCSDWSVETLDLLYILKSQLPEFSKQICVRENFSETRRSAVGCCCPAVSVQDENIQSVWLNWTGWTFPTIYYTIVCILQKFSSKQKCNGLQARRKEEELNTRLFSVVWNENNSSEPIFWSDHY